MASAIDGTGAASNRVVWRFFFDSQQLCHSEIRDYRASIGGVSTLQLTTPA